MTTYESKRYYELRVDAVCALTGDGFTVHDAEAFRPWRSRTGLVHARIVSSNSNGQWFIEYDTGADGEQVT